MFQSSIISWSSKIIDDGIVDSSQRTCGSLPGLVVEPGVLLEVRDLRRPAPPARRAGRAGGAAATSSARSARRRRPGRRAAPARRASGPRAGRRSAGRRGRARRAGCPRGPRPCAGWRSGRSRRPAGTAPSPPGRADPAGRELRVRRRPHLLRRRGAPRTASCCPARGPPPRPARSGGRRRRRCGRVRPRTSTVAGAVGLDPDGRRDRVDVPQQRAEQEGGSGSLRSAAWAQPGPSTCDRRLQPPRGAARAGRLAAWNSC